MTYQKKVVADLVTPDDATRNYELHFDIPDPQKQALYQAIMTVITVLLGIAMTLVAQLVGQAMNVTPPAIEAPADAMQTLGTTHFENMAIEGALDVGDGITVDIGDENVGLPSVLSTNIAYGTLSGAIATVPSGEIWLVHSVLVNVTANFNCTGDDCSLVIGDGNDADGFIVLADAALQAADTEGTGFAAGWQGMTDATVGVYLDTTDAPFVYAAADTIDYLIAGTSPAAGTATVYVIYTRIE